MAKHNVIMGTATGSVGDVTLMRRNGVQVARARVREVANPKTTAQAIQRNFVAPVAKFYAPLATMLEKSYEGLSKSKSYRAFLKKNIDVSRKKGWYLPKGTPFFPLPYQLSRGTVAPLDYRVDENGTPAAFYLNAGGVAGATVDNLTVGQFSQAFYREGYKPNDQITVIVIINQGDGEFIPAYCRFYLSADSTTLLKDSLGTVRLDSVGTYGVSFRTKFGNDVVAGAVIVSRRENHEWKRSTQFLACKSNILDYLTSLESADNSIKSYQDGQYQPISDVYLDGSSEALAYKTASGERVVLVGIVTRTLSDNTTRVYVVDDQGREWPLVNTNYHYYWQHHYMGTKDTWGSALVGTSDQNYIPVDRGAVELTAWLQSLGCAQHLFWTDYDGTPVKTYNDRYVLVTGLTMGTVQNRRVVVATTSTGETLPVYYNASYSVFFITEDGGLDSQTDVETYTRGEGNDAIAIADNTSPDNIMLMKRLNLITANYVTAYNQLHIRNASGATINLSSIDRNQRPDYDLILLTYSNAEQRFISKSTIMNAVPVAGNPVMTIYYQFVTVSELLPQLGALLGRGSTENSQALAMLLCAMGADEEDFYND